ncbi:MAG: LamG domain-containing protein [Proteobacteria bacterium]|nr:LamG domain-containing protein [Pseudomonadota bacterium]
MTWFGVEAPADIVTGTWTHVAVTFEVGSRLQLAINGTVRLADTNGANGRLAAPDLAIASTLARAGDGSPGYAGAIDEVRLWSVARAYDASNAMYLQKLAGGEPNLLVHYPVSAYASSDARGATLADQSGNGISGTLRGGVRWIPSRAPVDRPATPHSIGLSAATDTGPSSMDPEQPPSRRERPRPTIRLPFRSRLPRVTTRLPDVRPTPSRSPVARQSRG